MTTVLDATAKQYHRDVPMAPGFELWGSVKGRSVPFHREWWITKDGSVIGHLDQGRYEDSGAAAKQRRNWARSLGALAE
jgi:hypothetical protein